MNPPNGQSVVEFPIWHMKCCPGRFLHQPGHLLISVIDGTSCCFGSWIFEHPPNSAAGIFAIDDSSAYGLSID